MHARRRVRALILIILSPVIFASVGADDAAWVLEKGPDANGSVWEAIWQPVAHAFEFEANPRGTALAIADRQVLALITMKLATTFSITPSLVWALVKASLFALSIVATAVFLRQIRFRGADKEIVGLRPSTVAFVTITLPLVVAIGSKSQNNGSFNGWNFYPTLTYGTFVGYMLFAALVLRLSALLERSYRTWRAPVIGIMVLSAIAINLSYELVALVIPLSVLLLILAPRPDVGGVLARWRSALTILVPLLVTYTTLFVWIRWTMSQTSCHATDTCYAGTVVEVRGRTLLNNFLGSFPGNNGSLVTKQAKLFHRDFPSPNLASISIAVLAVVVLWALWSSWKARQPTPSPASRSPGTHSSDDSRGLWMLLLVTACIAIGSTVITGISERAVEGITTPMLSYRNAVATWSALSLGGITAVALMARHSWRPVRYAAILALLAIVIGSIAAGLPRNVLSAQTNRKMLNTQFIDTLHREVSIGDTSPTGDRRRCAALASEMDRRHVSSQEGLGRLATGAYRAFEFYHHKSFCSTDTGLSTSDRETLR
ncbi:hypothetical protein [Aeromicrobium sp.]|uniref:hypothetical protein n=1 Tax=Aeromicrobium sp. TaxID=1871063 RepID=UPI0019C62B27|nr:hypothetical protein [Aeromicrobium sp.]MBC7631141.1 hypothetical protein [Aeromicrobium sp.]